MIRKSSIFINAYALAFILSSCSDATFSGNNNKEKRDGQKLSSEAGEQPAPSGEAGDKPGPGADEGCQSAPDLNEKYEFKDAGDVIRFVNGIGIFTPIPGGGNAGAVKFDDITAKKVCELKGYAEVESKSSGSYKSPKDNQISGWDEALYDFSLKPASSFNRFIDNLKCKGKVKLQCPNAK